MDNDIETLKSNPSKVTPLGVVQLLNEIQVLRDLLVERWPKDYGKPSFDDLTLVIQQQGDQSSLQRP